MTIPTLKSISATIWVIPVVLGVTCAGPLQPVSLVGTVVYDDSNTLAREDMVPLKVATVFVTVKEHFEPPNAHNKNFSVQGAHLETPEGRRAKTLQDLVRGQPKFRWTNGEPVFAGEPGQLYRSQIDEEGNFRFDTLPPGRHMLTVLYRPTTAAETMHSMAREVIVKKGQTTRIKVILTHFDFVDL